MATVGVKGLMLHCHWCYSSLCYDLY